MVERGVDIDTALFIKNPGSLLLHKTLPFLLRKCPTSGPRHRLPNLCLSRPPSSLPSSAQIYFPCLGNPWIGAPVLYT